jgi:hypothetical protein
MCSHTIAISFKLIHHHVLISFSDYFLQLPHQFVSKVIEFNFKCGLACWKDKTRFYNSTKGSEDQFCP